MNQNNWGTYEPKAGDILCSFSRLLAFRESPELYKAKYIDKTIEQTKSMSDGTVIHECVLERELFNQKYILPPEETNQNNLDKKALEALCVQMGLKKSGNKDELILRIREMNPDFPIQIDEFVVPEGKMSIPPKLMKSCLAIYDKVYSHPKVGEWLKLSKKENFGYFTDPKTGVVIRFKIDGFFDYKNVHVITDFKTTIYWDKRRFEQKMFDEGIHIQMAVYKRALKIIEVKDVNAFLVIAVEPNTPHRTRYYQIDQATVEAGELELDHYLKEYKDRIERNDFSPRKEDDEIQTASLQAWSWDKISSIEANNE